MVNERADEPIIGLLRQRDGLPTEVTLRDGKTHLVFDIAWGYDDGDAFAHVTSNISPGGPDLVVDFFLTSDVVRISDPSTGKHLYG